jgi:hypothetical protein
MYNYSYMRFVAGEGVVLIPKALERVGGKLENAWWRLENVSLVVALYLVKC